MDKIIHFPFFMDYPYDNVLLTSETKTVCFVLSFGFRETF